ncbi:hypothetical protein E6W26_29170 [Pseudomonas aeruginosa]|uniref:hypothetical protein n=1 Tax=Pseudomonas aeruginosa TaxID=287 RepID=UPI00109DF3CB|nr:hypothetical protein [Pseudomonas aeruginosa]EKV1241253.1 hypothetical protein [Pseudomonas aeruginosa]EKV8586162.1 hypothetical protein [Pseudomonas aeruginosa]ELN5407380.1 hypothetical protein [Pseudomonas aeruginosa]ELP1438571.1 hypothetical protein [Pseudomonas aeruginosa]THB16471.1 hypothetical protein E6W26_29170 [Pseudomonas aeruginosa]
MNNFDMDELDNILGGHLEENTARIAVNETKEANKASVQKKENNAKADIAELTKQKKTASFKRNGKGNINRSENSSIAFERAKLIFELEERTPTDSKLNEYLMIIGEELLYAAQKNTELRAFLKNLGIPKP